MVPQGSGLRCPAGRVTFLLGPDYEEASTADSLLSTGRQPATSPDHVEARVSATGELTSCRSLGSGADSSDRRNADRVSSSQGDDLRGRVPAQDLAGSVAAALITTSSSTGQPRQVLDESMLPIRS